MTSRIDTMGTLGGTISETTKMTMEKTRIDMNKLVGTSGLTPLPGGGNAQVHQQAKATGQLEQESPHPWGEQAAKHGLNSFPGVSSQVPQEAIVPNTGSASTNAKLAEDSNHSVNTAIQHKGKNQVYLPCAVRLLPVLEPLLPLTGRKPPPKLGVFVAQKHPLARYF